MSRAPGTRGRGDAGTSTLEVVLVLPVLMLFFTGAVQVGLWFHSRHIAGAAATAASRAARAQGGLDRDGVHAATDALDRDGAAMVRDPVITITRTPTTVTVTVAGHSPSIVTGLNQDVSVTITAPIEQFS